MKKRNIAVIGGGISGIANAIHLTKCGYSVTLFEKHHELGGVWVNGMSNEKSHLQTASWAYNFIWGLKWKSKFPIKNEIVDNIKIASERMSEVHIKLSALVTKLTISPSEKVIISTNTEEEEFDGCIIATGLHQSHSLVSKKYTNTSIDIANFNQLDSVCFKEKNIAIVGLGASAMEAFKTATEAAAAKITFITSGCRWIFPNIKIYNLLAFSPFGRPGQLIDKLVHKRLIKVYKKNKITEILPPNSPGYTKPGSISKYFFDEVKKKKPTFYTQDSIENILNKKIILNSGKEIDGIDTIIFCTGWLPLNFDFIKDENLHQKMKDHIEKGYMFMHEMIPGYNQVVFSNCKTGVGSAGFAPVISSLLLQNYLEQKSIFPSYEKQSKWVDKEVKRWFGSPKSFQFLNMFSPIFQNFLFFSHPLRFIWFFKKVLKMF